ncbi:uncharacterized protein LOC119327697 [Triticum dicoccoides]|uniref:uncharacterized protein LOC119327697 n=1 Tax=Triticum dicoccoides TaxID=85692 RepID=UPI001891A907|nr:uncharacterized protein LOC119327697 [Triticum dicoccoides]
MAPAADDVLDGGNEKSIFRCLDAARYVVAAAVSVLIMAVIVYAITVVLRPADLYIGVLQGSVSVSVSGGDNLRRPPFNASIGRGNLTFSFTVRAINPSGRVSIYYTDVEAKIKSNMSSASSTLLRLRLPDVSLGPKSSIDSNILMNTFALVKKQVYYFNMLANGSSIDDAMIAVEGTRTVEVYSGRNVTDHVRVFYFCSPIVVGGDKDDDSEAAVDVQCTDQNQPASS